MYDKYDTFGEKLARINEFFVMDMNVWNNYGVNQKPLKLVEMIRTSVARC